MLAKLNKSLKTYKLIYKSKSKEAERVLHINIGKLMLALEVGALTINEFEEKVEELYIYFDSLEP